MNLREQKLTVLNQISDKRAALFAKLGIENLEDLLFFFPRAYEDLSDVTPLHLVQDGDVVTIKATVVQALKTTYKGRLNWTKSKISDGVTLLDVIWFNQPWLNKKVKQNQEYYLYGKIQRKNRSFSIQSPQIYTEDEYQFKKIQAIYPLTAGLTQNIVRNAVAQALQINRDELIDAIPVKIREEQALCSLDFALEKIHQPEQKAEYLIARKRLAFEELFLVRAALLNMKKQRTEHAEAISLQGDSDLLKEKMSELFHRIPFQLTNAQSTAINTLLQDLKKEKPMNRLLQGDVGSGKTIVAAFAMAYTVWCQGQVIFMAPTSILAKQHFLSLQRYLAPLGIKISLLTGQTTQKERNEILAAAENGDLDVLVGTHAVLEKDISFQNLAFVITDEQHRFGVAQRAAITHAEDKQLIPHRLVMSATPIPRTLGLIIYGDLDLTIMNELPQGRKEIKTYRATKQDEDRIYRLIRKTVERNEQVYIVCPLISESEEMELDSAEETYKFLSSTVFPDLEIGLLHGSLKADQKDQVMEEFLQNKVKILVSTTVIEVGVDNPRATLMVIKNAERFGLAQLHQLRGRIGRSDLESMCILLSDSKDQLAINRLKTLCRTQDGFVLAEEDLKLRGPGDFFGVKQHGLPAFKLINLYEDQELIQLVDHMIEKIYSEYSYATIQEKEKIINAIIQRYPELYQGITL